MGKLKKAAKLSLIFVAANLLILGIGWVFLVLSSGILALQFEDFPLNSSSLGAFKTGIFWITIWAALLSVLFLWLTRNQKQLSKPIFRWTFMAYLGLGLLGGLGMAVTIAFQAAETTATCSMDSVLEPALGGAVYPIATEHGNGTAFAVNAEGSLVTAYHVIEGSKQVYANFASGKVPITVVKTAPEYDLALLKIDQPTPRFLNLVDKYEVTDEVYAVGWPRNTYFGGQASISGGIISRILSPEDTKQNFSDVPANYELVQTDTALNPGNSGGPLINSCGVVGVVSAKSDSNQLQDYGFVSEEGISYMVSARTIRQVFGL